MLVILEGRLKKWKNLLRIALVVYSVASIFLVVQSSISLFHVAFERVFGGSSFLNQVSVAGLFSVVLDLVPDLYSFVLRTAIPISLLAALWAYGLASSRDGYKISDACHGLHDPQLLKSVNGVCNSMGIGSPLVLVDEDYTTPNVLLVGGNDPVLVLSRPFLRNFSDSPMLEAAIAHEMGHFVDSTVPLKTTIASLRRGLEVGTERVMQVLVPALLASLLLNVSHFFSPIYGLPLSLFSLMSALVILITVPAYIAIVGSLVLFPLLVILGNTSFEMEVAADLRAVSETSLDTMTTLLRSLNAPSQEFSGPMTIARDFVLRVRSILSGRHILQYVFKLPSICLLASYDYALAYFSSLERRIDVLEDPTEIKPMGVQSLKVFGQILLQTSLKDKYGRSGFLTAIVFSSILWVISAGRNPVNSVLIITFTLMTFPALSRCAGRVYELFTSV